MTNLFLIPKIRRVTSIFLLSVVLMFSSIMSAGATETKGSNNDRQVVKTWRVTENGLVELTPAEVASLHETVKKQEKSKSIQKANQPTQKLRSENSSSEITPMAPPLCGTNCTWDVYNEYNRVPVPVHKERKRVTPAVYNGASASFSVSQSYTYSINLTLTANIKKALQVALGGSWSDSTTYQENFNVSAPPEKYAWYDFTPIKTNSYGWMEHWENNYYTNWKDKLTGSTWTDLYMTRKVNGFQDGIVELVTSYSYPTY